MYVQPQRAVGALALVLAVLLTTLVANDLRREYNQQSLAASTQISSLTQLLEEHTRQSMRRVELALSEAARELQKVPPKAPTPPGLAPSLGSRLQAYLPQDGLVTAFSVIDASGKTVASTLSEAVADLPLVNDRDYYLAHQQAGHDGMFVGQAVKSETTGLWSIPVSIRLEGAAGGYLMAAVDPEYFQHLYQSIDTGDNGFVTLFTTEGWAIARWPFNSEISERNWLESPMFKKQIPLSPAAVVQQKVVASGVDSMYSYRVLQDFPLVVTLGISLDDALVPWRERARFEGWGLLLFFLILGGTTALLVRQLQRRMQVETALQLSETSVLKSSLPTLWIGSDARVLRVNQAACELHGYPEAQMLAMAVPDLNPAMSMDRWDSHWQRLRQARNMRFETTHRTAWGEDVPVEVELNFIEFNGREYNFSFIRDLRLRKLAEGEIQRGAALLRSAIDAVDEAFVLFDTDDRMVYCNAKYANLYPGMQDVVVPGMRFEDMLRTGAQRGLYREALGREEEWLAERLRAHREGQEIRIQKRDDGSVMRVIDRRTPEGNIVGIRVDITEMVKATEEAQEASRYKSQFLANMSHEIRTPMNAILGLLALLQNTALSPTQRDYACKTEGAAQSLLRLLNDILDFSKVEAGKMELDPQPLRLDHLLRDIAVILSANMAGKGIEVIFDIDPAVPAVVVADAMRLQQVLVNLGSNAIKFTLEGQVVLRLRPLPDPAADAATPGPQTLLEFSLQDSGIGIAQEQQEHIFSGFSQAEASTTRRFGGTGLGLAISRRLIELMGGTLSLASTPGQGSTFSFALRLPRVADLPQDLPQPPRLSLLPQRVLVVDDNPVARAILAAMTRAWSWPTTLADSGSQALDLLRSQRSAEGLGFDVVYLDWQMPEMDGWETARQIRQLGQGLPQQPRIIMLSANSHDSLTLRTAQEQALIDGFLFKPVTASAMQEAALSPLHSDVQAQPVLRSSRRLLAGLRLLVVEDNLINQQVAEELLNAEGALVSLAANGQLGVDAVAASQPAFDAVLMDLQMPVLDGFGATRKIREDLGLTTLPIVAMTANALASDRQACLAAGMNEHVGKPFDIAHLVAVLLRVTGRNAVTGEGAVPLPEAEPATFSSPYLELGPALDRISGLTSLYLDIAQEFLQTLDAVEGEFQSAARDAQLDRLRAQMHTLKGTAATLGATLLSRHAAGLETLFKRAAPGLQAAEHLPGLLELLQHTRLAVLQAIDSLATPPTAPDGAPRLSGPQERAQAKAFLQQLSSLLVASNLAALDLFAQRADALQALSQAQVDEMQEALRGLDLELARQQCDRHIAALA